MTAAALVTVGVSGLLAPAALVVFVYLGQRDSLGPFAADVGASDPGAVISFTTMSTVGPYL